MISIIIRTKNEERWITRCLEAIKKQTIQDHEIILVDNQSDDKTVDRAKAIYPELTLVTIKEFKPGLAINEGIRSSKGDYLVCLSAHCPPVHEKWLENLVNNLDDEKVAGVYGRQIPVSFSRPNDKRDLLLTFGLDKRIQVKDSFFHNANSMFSRKVWEKFPFDEQVTNIEDRVWGREVIEHGYKIVYEPDAEVYHYHGIHQNNNEERLSGVVRIMENMDITLKDRKSPLKPEELNIACFIPVKESQSLRKEETFWLLEKTILTACESTYVDRIILLTDSHEIASFGKKFGAETPFIRPPELSQERIRVDDVLKYALNKMESDGYHPELIVPLEISYPFRPKGMIDYMIEEQTNNGFDTVITAIKEVRPCWIVERSEVKNLIQYSKHKEDRNPVHIGLVGLGCVTYPEFIRKGSRIGEKVGLYEFNDPMSLIEITDSESFSITQK